MSIITGIETHQATTRMDFPQIVAHLNTHLGPSLVALLAGVKDRKMPAKWASGDVTPRVTAEQRVRNAHRAWMIVATAETDHIARAWFIGTNPYLGERSPVEVLRDADGTDIARVLVAAENFVENQ
ncbi:hypothetical protein KDN32_03750 [Nocardioides sp. J2M5]|uniref:hypothetical protein n=1 Tax=Nocardioides palaemonis TaxID=2829810 RepID=UPI001BA7E05A|nr:hypothetical protein [Nocardioides palaemonis]MBS2936856.1 hypothetical protein [Nocardioides palaemonis]